jgi:hypothetical protein
MTACRRSMKARRSFRTRWTNGSRSLKPRSSGSTPSAMPTILTRSRAAACSSCCPMTAEARIERGFIRAEDEKPEAEEASDGETVIDGVRVNGDGEIIEDGDDEGTPHITPTTRTPGMTASRCPTFSSAT